MYVVSKISYPILQHTRYTGLGNVLSALVEEPLYQISLFVINGRMYEARTKSPTLSAPQTIWSAALTTNRADVGPISTDAYGVTRRRLPAPSQYCLIL